MDSCASVRGMMPARRPTALAVGAGTATTLALTAVLLGRSVGRGVLLYRDFVTVPDPVLTRRTLGLEGPAPRAVPLDAVTALAGPVVPSGVQQQLLLVATLLIAGLGVTGLLRHRGPVATTVAAASATWSPYAVERLLLGQPPTLLGVAVLPWVVLVAREASTRRWWLLWTALAALPAALTPVGGVLAGGGAFVAARTWRRATPRDLVPLALLVVAWCSPWLAVALTGRTDAGQASGAPAFAVRADGLTGILDVLTGGGVWSVAATPESRGQLLTLCASAAVLALALVGLASLRQHRRLGGTLLLGPPLLALGLATAPGLDVFMAVQSVPGLALLRDTHRWVGIAAMTASVLSGLGASVLAARLSAWTSRPSADRTALVARDRAILSNGSGAFVASTAVALLGASLAVLAVPDAAARLADAYRPVRFPSGWSAVVAAVGERHALVLPFQPLRAAAWAGPHPFLDPTGLALPGPVTTAHDLRVTRDGHTLVIGSADPPEAKDWSAGRVDSGRLRELGIEVVLEWHGTPGHPLRDVPGLVERLRTPELSVWEVVG